MGWLKSQGNEGHGQGARGSAWMAGITPARLGVVALVCILVRAVNPATLADHFWMRAGRSLHNAGIHFISSLPMLVLVVRADLWTARDSDRRRITMLALAVIAGASLWSLVAANAQVDPAFVLRTLEEVERAYEVDTARGDVLLDRFIVYLRDAIPRLRTGETTAMESA